MRSVALGATTGVGGCQTLGQVSEQMDSLLDGQSSQRILPNESCLLAKGEGRVQCHKRVTQRGYSTWAVEEKITTELHEHTHQHQGLLTAYEIMFSQNGYLQLRYTYHITLHHSKEHPTHTKKKQASHFPSESLPTKALSCLSPVT